MSKNDKNDKSIVTKERIENIAYSLVIISLVVITFYVSYYYGLYLNKGSESNIPIGQEFRIKDIINGSNSTFTIIYYDNDKNSTEKYMVQTEDTQFNFTQSNSTVPVLKLEKIENNVQYWDIYLPKK